MVQAMKDEAISADTPSDPRVKLHRRVPHCSAARQFKVEAEEWEVTHCAQIVQQGCKMNFELEGEMGEMLARKHVGKSEEAFGKSAPPADGILGASTQVSKRSADHVDAEDETPAQKKARECLAKFQALEEEKAQREERKQHEKVQREQERAQKRKEQKEQKEEHARTPVGRAEMWAKGLLAYIGQAESEAKNCVSGSCGLPKNLAKEYQSTWDSKARSFKVTRTAILKILDSTELPEDFESRVDTCEKNLRSFKDDMQRYRTLCRSYTKAKP